MHRNKSIVKRNVGFSLLRGSDPDQALFRSSILLFFEITSNGNSFPIHAFIINLILSLLILIVFVSFLIEETINSTALYNVPRKLYCSNCITTTLLTEITAQTIHLFGSILLIKRHKILCYVYMVCSILSFLISAAIRVAQLFLCEEKLHPKMLPLKRRPDLPPYFKLTLMWLVCQMFWYWLVFSFVVAQLEWFKILRRRKTNYSASTGDSTRRPAPSFRRFRSSTSKNYA